MTGDTPATDGQRNRNVTLPGGLRLTLPGGLPGGPAIWLAAAAFVLALLALIIGITAHAGLRRPPGAIGQVGPTIPAGPRTEPPTPTGAAVPPSPTATGPVSTQPGGAGEANCPPAGVTVTDAKSLTAALTEAAPGTSIRMADGVYAGRFKATAPGTAERPIFLCGGTGAVIDGEDIKGGYALHLDGASHWRLVGFTVRNGQKGVMVDRVQHIVIRGLTIEQIGDEAIHLRNFSSDNVVEGNTIRNTGLRRDKFGEGIYIGSAESNWCTITNCKPDLSDRNVVRGNHISDTTAESIDIKEGTTGGIVSGNTFDGKALSGSHADSWVDVKGNGWVIEGNVGRNALTDGFQTHQVVDGWGRNNVFKGNTAEVNGPGWGFHFAPVNGNKASCDNKVTGAAKGFGNADCA